MWAATSTTLIKIHLGHLGSSLIIETYLTDFSNSAFGDANLLANQ